jgi:hypothetical protein
MQKTALVFMLMPMLIGAAAQSTVAVPSLNGFAELSWHRPKPAKEVYSDTLSIALGREIDPEMMLVYVLLDPKDGGTPKYVNDRFSLKHRKTGKIVDFPKWLPLEWFQGVQDGEVVTRKLFGKFVWITCGQQAGGKPFHVRLAELMQPYEMVTVEVSEMDGAASSSS